MNLLETERLLIRHFALDDLDAIQREVYGDPEVAQVLLRPGPLARPDAGVAAVPVV